MKTISSKKLAPALSGNTSSSFLPLETGEESDHAVVEALQVYFRQNALSRRTILPRWASW